MKIIQFAALFTLLSVSFPLAQASESSNTNKDVIQKQEDDAINPIVTTSSSSNLLRGAANLAWDLLVASNGDGKDGNDEFISEECHPVCCDQHTDKCWCCGSAQKDDADAGEGTKASFDKASYATKKFIQKGEEKNVNSRPQFIKKSEDDDDDKNEKVRLSYDS